MKEQLIKAIQRNQPINMIYLSKEGTISKRCVKIIKIACDSFQAYCFTRRAKRTFIIDNVLAISPIVSKERDVM
ncbi:transcriptional regulator [Lysinibacillus contaminans]|uniref:Transcriptional regulator n=1 Tax=Lysinibacillus contaminans TaxID=1293441 RepID=A0ABR5K150_9BACI|nr:transcriptional regulator [Lysinibacillus contaminans]KOS68461.1 transcriptional regulator [Lysinibacillus contaminans]